VTANGKGWRGRAACRGMDPELFFPVGTQEASPEVKAACARCPVRGECLDFGLAEADGVWAGLTEPERRSLLAAVRERRVA
jgi:WhiB family transcriptional regulator, redox-sensing transcriptional regulator